jgi:hypothetical protein
MIIYSERIIISNKKSYHNWGKKHTEMFNSIPDSFINFSSMFQTATINTILLDIETNTVLIV